MRGLNFSEEKGGEEEGRGEGSGGEEGGETVLRVGENSHQLQYNRNNIQAMSITTKNTRKNKVIQSV